MGLGWRVFFSVRAARARAGARRRPARGGAGARVPPAAAGGSESTCGRSHACCAWEPGMGSRRSAVRRGILWRERAGAAGVF